MATTIYERRRDAKMAKWAPFCVCVDQGVVHVSSLVLYRNPLPYPLLLHANAEPAYHIMHV
jgi:hypothetical protein